MTALWEMAHDSSDRVGGFEKNAIVILTALGGENMLQFWSEKE